MCNRYRPADRTAIDAQWQLKPGPLIPPWKEGIGPWGQGPFIRLNEARTPELVVGQWALAGDDDPRLNMAPRMTNNMRWESIKQRKPTFLGPWERRQRCVIPAFTYDEPYYAEIDGKSIWWPFRRKDGQPWHLAGLWNRWKDKVSGELTETYTMVTVNCDQHPLLSRFHKFDPKLPTHKQDKRTVVPLEIDDLPIWLGGTNEEAAALLKPPAEEIYDGAPV